VGRRIDGPINTPDLMPTLLGLCGLPIPPGVDGTDYTAYLDGKAPAPAAGALLACYAPFGEFVREEGGREYRGVRTARYTYVETLEGPWLLYDDRSDPFQLKNLVDCPDHADVREDLQQSLRRLLAKAGDGFEPAENYIRRFGYSVDETGTASIQDFR
jgi:arylsulfatase A-like enzyme